jgi:hypothetical protein
VKNLHEKIHLRDEVMRMNDRVMDGLRNENVSQYLTHQL